jgi:formylglycine-generating enzyme required for sulfatase activity
VIFQSEITLSEEDGDDPFFQSIKSAARHKAQLHVELPADHERTDQRKESIPNIADRLMSPAVKRAVLLGDPGSGKTFTLRWLTVLYADQWKRDHTQPIPVFIPLRNFSGQVKNKQTQQQEKRTFAEFVTAQLDVLAPYLPRLLREKRLVLLCDALNEMPRKSPFDQRDLVDEVQQYLKRYEDGRIVVSCRELDYKEDLSNLYPLEKVLVRPLDLPAIEGIMSKRLPDPNQAAGLLERMGVTPDLRDFKALVEKKGEAERFWQLEKGVPRYYTSGDHDRAWQDMHRRGLLPLARNPFLLGIICDLWRDAKTPGDNRPQLFKQFVAELLKRERDQALKRGQAWAEGIESLLDAALVELAKSLQRANRTVITRTDALPLIGATGTPSATWILDVYVSASILLEDAGGIRFAHQLLQEYYACRVLLAALEHDEQHNTNTAGQFFKDHGGAGWWEAGVWGETIVILGEFLNDPNRVARWLAPVSPEVGLSAILRNGAGLTVKDVQPETFETVRKAAWSLAEEPDPRGRASAYRALGLFDPTIYDSDRRAGVGVFWSEQHKLWLPHIAWCDVPGGEFIMGSDDEKPRRIEKVASFRMAKYPITHRQYQCFLDDPEGYHNPEWRKHLHSGVSEYMQQPRKQTFKFWNHPRETVNWYQVMVFCGWATARLGFAVTLPTERQWERAARGKNGLIYPYEGDFDPLKGNTYETGIRQTSAVGIFPEGDSPEDILDLSGNVWEWMLNEYDDTANISSITDNRRSVRGGSWNDYSIYARSSARFRNDLFDLDFILGFRLVALSSIP